MEEHHEDELLVDDLNEVYQSAIKGQNLSKNVLRFQKWKQHLKVIMQLRK